MPVEVDPSFQRLAEQLQDLGDVKLSSMFGVPCLMIGRKPLAASRSGGVAFKLSGEAVQEALSLPGAGPWDPMETGRVMKNWVWIPESQLAQWPAFARQARETVLAEPDKPPKPRKVGR